MGVLYEGDDKSHVDAPRFISTCYVQMDVFGDERADADNRSSTFNSEAYCDLMLPSLGTQKNR